MDGEQSARVDAKVKAGLSGTVEGTCEGYDFAARLVKVNIGGTVIPMPWLGSMPWKGDTVRVLTLGETRVCQAVYGSAMGTVVTIASNIATVTGDDGRTYFYPVRIGDTLAAGNRVRLDHAGQLVLGRYAAEPLASEYFVPGAPPSDGVGAQSFRPIDSGNYRFGVFMGQDVQVNENRTGLYWYGTQIADTIPDGATVTRAEVQLVETSDSLPSVASLLGTHGQPSRGAGEPSIAGSIPISSSGTFDILPLANALKTGAAYGIGFQIVTGYRSFGAFDSSGSIYMEWN